jgi:hypothetical protein
MDKLTLDRFKNALDQLPTESMAFSIAKYNVFNPLEQVIQEKKIKLLRNIIDLIAHHPHSARQDNFGSLFASIQYDIQNRLLEIPDIDYLPLIIHSAEYSKISTLYVASRIVSLYTLGELLNEYKQYVSNARQFPEFDNAHGKGALLAYLSQELLLRGIPIDEYEPITTFLTAIRNKQHDEIQQMAWLPNRLMPVEQSLARKRDFTEYAPKHSLYIGWGPSINWRFDQTYSSIGLKHTPRPKSPKLKELIDPEIHERIIAVTEDWPRFTAHIFKARKTLRASDISPALLARSGGACFDSASHIALQRISLREVYKGLFATIEGGPTYGPGTTPAIARHRTWKSLSGLCGAAQAASVEEINTICEQSQWFSFGADGTWFYASLWGLGLIALRPDGKTLALFAATSHPD